MTRECDGFLCRKKRVCIDGFSILCVVSSVNGTGGGRSCMCLMGFLMCGVCCCCLMMMGGNFVENKGKRADLFLYVGGFCGMKKMKNNGVDFVKEVR